MDNILDTVTKAKPVETGVSKPKAVAEGLGDILCDTYALLIKTHGLHWNVEGPLFYGIHMLTEAQYGDLFAATDEIAERIRALGQPAPGSVGDIAKGTVLKGPKSRASAGDMVQALAEDHARIAKRLHDLVELAEAHKDVVTADLATARSAFHEKAGWMLKALLAG